MPPNKYIEQTPPAGPSQSDMSDDVLLAEYANAAVSHAVADREEAGAQRATKRFVIKAKVYYKYPVPRRLRL
jgi:hypothetical protein